MMRIKSQSQIVEVITMKMSVLAKEMAVGVETSPCVYIYVYIHVLIHVFDVGAKHKVFLCRIKCQGALIRILLIVMPQPL